MGKHAQQYVKAGVGGAVLLAFLTVLWLGLMMPMAHDGKHAMPFDCPFMQGGSLCTMTLNEHLSLWKRLTNAPVSAGLAQLFAGMLALLVISRFWFSHKETFAYAHLRARHRWRVRVWKTGDWLSAAFSQGILNPKSW